MNVLISSFVHWWNAEAAYAAVLGEELLKAGHKAWILTQPDTLNEAELRKRGLPLITNIPPAGGNPLRWKKTLASLAELQEREHIQIVNVFRSAELPLHLYSVRNAPGSKVVRTRGTDQAVKSNWLNRKIYREWCDGLIASSQAVRGSMSVGLGLPEDAVRIIYYPIDLPPLLSLEQRRTEKMKFLAEQRIAGEPFLLGVVGRLYPEKGHIVLLEALEKLVRVLPDVLLVILAKYDKGDDPERPRLEAKVRQARLEPYVRFLGFREDLRKLMAAMDLGVIPSIASEVNCRVAVEFMSVGTPVAAFPTGALPEVITHGVSGVIIPSHDPDDLTETLKIMAQDEQMRHRLGEGARRLAGERFSRSRFLAETMEVFEQALARGS